LGIREKKLRKNHPDLGRSLNNIGYIYSLRGDLKQALSYFLRAAAILEGSLTPAHEDTITSYYNIADAYTRMGELDNAAEWFRKATEQGDEESLIAVNLLQCGLK
jgi:tetratricopeptide (TPR) repeat protein